MVTKCVLNYDERGQLRKTQGGDAKITGQHQKRILMFKKLIFLCTVIAVWAAAQDIVWYKNFAQGQAAAQASNKQLLVLITTDVCPWCMKLKHETLKDPRIIKQINDRFVAVELNRDRDAYPPQFRSRVVPTTFFATKDGQLLIRPVIGFWDSENYSSYIDDAVKKIR